MRYNNFMTDAERLAKNNRIREKGKETREKRKGQICRVYRVKIDISHLNAEHKTQLKMIFVEAKWLYNDALTFMKSHDDINEYNYTIKEVQGLDKDRQPVTREIKYLASQMRQSVIAGIKHNLHSLSSLKNSNHKTGSLRYKSEYASINLQQHDMTYKFYDKFHIRLQGFKKRIRIRGAEQFFNIPGIEYANAKLLNLPDGYYMAVTTYQDKNKEGEQKKYKPCIGIDMGIKTSITVSDGRKIKVLIGETKRLKKCQKKLARRKKGSSNRYKMRKLLKKEYQKLTRKKRDAANKIVNELLQHEKIYMQDENLKGWHKGLFGRTVQHSILGLVKAKLMKSEQVIVLPKSEPTTKYCPNCKKVNRKITLSDRIYQCVCGYVEDRDIHAAKNMILLGQRHGHVSCANAENKNTCGTQEINAFEEDIRRYESQDEYCSLDELGSPHSYKLGVVHK